MLTCLVGTISLLGALGCGGQDPVGPRQDILRPAPMLGPGSAGPCARVQLQIVGGTTAQASFAADSGCATGLALIGAGAVGYLKYQRKVSIPVRVVNRGPGGRDAPILVVLPKDSGVVTAPANVSARVGEDNADSVGASGSPDVGAAFWTLLGSGGTIPGDSTPIRTLQVVLPNKTTAARLSFEIRAELPDSALPMIPDQMTFAAESLYVIEDSLGPGYDYYRRMIGMRLHPGADGFAFRALLQKYGASLAGGSSSVGIYILRFPDPGPTWSHVKAVLDSVHAEAIVRVAYPMTRSGGPGRIDGRYPRDGGFLRESWIQRAAGLWAPLAVRAPQAWSCENGRYPGSQAPLVYQIEAAVPAIAVDVPNLSHAVVPFPIPGREVSEAQRTMDLTADSTTWTEHAAAVSSVVSASADNQIGIAGMVWGGASRVLGIGARNYVEPSTAATALVQGLVPLLRAESPRIIVSTIGIGSSTDSAIVDFLRTGLLNLLEASPNLLWIQTAGNQRVDRSLADLRGSRVDGAALDRALMELREQGYADQILFVAGTEPGNAAWDGGSIGSGFYLGHTGIAAPAEGVWAATTTGALAFGNGTSFAAPLVAGTAALLLATDPSLTPAQVLDYLVRGSRVAVRDSLTGQLVPSAPVTGFPEPVHELDAYGSLQLFSDDRDAAPLCGHQLVADPLDSFAVLRDFQRVRGGRIGGAQWYPARVSVAPGGRLLSAWLNQDSLNGGSHSVASFDPWGSRVSTWRNYSALYDGEDVFALQRSTLTSYYIDRYSREPGGLLSSTLLLDSTGAPAYVWPDFVHLHPAGRFLFYRELLFDLATGIATRFHEGAPSCQAGQDCTSSAWDLAPDGSKLVLLQRTSLAAGGWNSRLQTFPVSVAEDGGVTVSGPTQDVFLPGVGLQGAYFGDEGRIVATPLVSSPGSDCQVQLRAGAALGTVAETTTWLGMKCPDPNGLWQMSRQREVARGSP